MAVHHLTITLGTTSAPIIAQSGSTPTINVLELQIESETGNADVKVGGSTVSTTDYGRTVEAGPSKAITMRPTSGRPINLATTYLIGTSTQKVHCLYIT